MVFLSRGVKNLQWYGMPKESHPLGGSLLASAASCRAESSYPPMGGFSFLIRGCRPVAQPRRPAACMTASTAATGSLPQVMSTSAQPALSSRSRALSVSSS